MVDEIVRRMQEMHISVQAATRTVALACATLCAGVMLGNILIIARGVNRLNLALVYPALFGLAALAWLAVAFGPTALRSSWAASLTAVPSLLRAGDFAVTWIVDGTDTPGIRIVAIAGWALAATLAIGLSLTLTVLAHRSGVT